MSHDNEEAIATQIVDAAYQTHVAFGPGLFESAYEAVLAYELAGRGVPFTRQHPVPITYKGVQIDQSFRADFLVAGKVVVEVKSVEPVAPVHRKQLLTYLRILNLRLGLLINFNEERIKNGIHRVVNGFLIF
jgi:GxxExxY protein